VRQRSLLLVTSVLVASLLPAACGTGPNDTHVLLGNIDGGAGLQLVRGPDVLSAGTPTDFVVNTFGSSSCTTPDHADVKHPEPMVFEVTPWDRVPDGNVPCTADYGERPHPITIAYPQTGTGVLRIIGMRHDPTLNAARRDTVEVTVEVKGRA
jgi:hypothetical protein